MLVKRKKRNPEPPPAPDPVPEHIASAAVMRRNKVTRAGLNKFQEQMLLAYTPELARNFFASLLRGVRTGDAQSMRLYADICGYVQKGGGVNIFNNMQMAAVTTNGNGGYSFDRIIRELNPTHTVPALEAAPSITVDVDPTPVEPLEA